MSPSTTSWRPTEHTVSPHSAPRPQPEVEASPAPAAAARRVRATSLQLLNESTRGLITDILVKGPLSRADLARSSGWSPASMTRITRPLLEARLLIETESGPPARTGRPSLPLDVDADLVHLIGINLTGSTITLVRTDLRAAVLEVVRMPLISHDPETVADQIAVEVTAQIVRDPRIQLLGVSLAGPISPTSEVLGNSAFLGWTGVPLVAMIEQRTGLQTLVDNDVRALTAAEHWFGAAAGLADFVVITLGAGIGCGLVVDNRLVSGVGGGSGHIGHLPITPDGPMCERGHRGCARSYLATASIVGQLRAVMAQPDLTYNDVVRLAGAGHPLVRRVAEDAARALGQLIGTVSSLTAPAKVLVSGEGVELIALFEDLVRERARAVQHWSVTPAEIELAPFTTTEWARGAAVSALRRHIENQTAVDGTGLNLP